MAQAARRGHPSCATCKAPTSVRASIAQRARRGDSLRSISEYAVNEGHALGRDGIAHHLRNCVGITEQQDGSDPLTRSVLTARTVAWVMRGWLSRLETIAEALHEHGLTVEADIVLGADPGHMRKALADIEPGSPAEELLAARALALACAHVFGVAHPEVAREMAASLAEQGADSLSADLLYLADRATAYAATAAKDRRSEEKVSPGSGSAPPAVAQPEESA